MSASDHHKAGGARSRRRISTGSPFEAAWGYSRLVIDGPFAFVAGTTGYDYVTMLLPEDAAEQARNAWATIAQTLRQGGFALEDIVRATYYVTSRDDARAVLDVCGATLADIRPAATIVIVAGLLAPEMKVEIEVTALHRDR